MVVEFDKANFFSDFTRQEKLYGVLSVSFDNNMKLFVGLHHLVHVPRMQLHLLEEAFKKIKATCILAWHFSRGFSNALVEIALFCAVENG